MTNFLLLQFQCIKNSTLITPNKQRLFEYQTLQDNHKNSMIQFNIKANLEGVYEYSKTFEYSNNEGFIGNGLGKPSISLILETLILMAYIHKIPESLKICNKISNSYQSRCIHSYGRAGEKFMALECCYYITISTRLEAGSYEVQINNQNARAVLLAPRRACGARFRTKNYAIKQAGVGGRMAYKIITTELRQALLNWGGPAPGCRTRQAWLIDYVVQSLGCGHSNIKARPIENHSKK